MLAVKLPNLSAGDMAIAVAWLSYSAVADDSQRVRNVAADTELTTTKVREVLKEKKVADWLLLKEIERSGAIGVDTSNTMLQLARMVYFDPAKVLDPETGAPLPLNEIEEETRAAIQGVTVRITKGGTTVYEYKFVDRSSNLDRLMTMLGMFELDNQQRAEGLDKIMSYVYSHDSRLPVKVIDEAEDIETTEQETAEPMMVSGDPAALTFENPYAARRT